jgi:hypothetical protein
LPIGTRKRQVLGSGEERMVTLAGYDGDKEIWR